MNNVLAYLSFGILCMMFQGTVLAYLGVGGLRIELLLIIITYVALNYSLTAGSILAFVLGYIYDLNSASPLGLHVLSFLTCFLSLNLIRGRLYIQGPAFCIGLTAAMVLFHEFVLFVFLSSRGSGTFLSFSQIAILIPRALLTGALWPFFSSIMKNIDERFPPPLQPKKTRSGLQFK